MKIEKLLDFYRTCATSGFAKIIKGIGAVSIYIPLKNKTKPIYKIIMYDAEDNIFFESIKSICWISYKLSVNNFFRITKFMEKMHDEKSEIDYELKFHKNRVKITGFGEDGRKIGILKLRLFSVNVL